MQYKDLDWNRMWAEAREARSWQAKKKSDWDRRADAFARRTGRSSYAGSFLERMRPDASWSVLDVGAGPGTLALPLASRVARVTALDFSRQMLDLLEERAREKALSNIRVVECSWDDDWAACGVDTHDAVLASRSLAVRDLRPALEKLDRHAKKAVFLTDRVGATPFDPEVFAAAGRPFTPGPDYIYTVNLLYQMGIRAAVDFIRLESADDYESIEEVVASCAWMIDDPSAGEMAGLRAYVARRLEPLAGGGLRFHRGQPACWAFISWRKD